LAAKQIDVAWDGHFQPDAESYADVIAELRRRRIQLVYLAGYGSDIGLLLRESTAIDGPLRILAGDTAGDTLVARLGAKMANGLIFTRRPQAARTALTERLVSAAEAQGARSPDNVLLTYAAVETWAAAAKRAGTFDGPAVAAALHEASAETVIGPVAFDAKGDVLGEPGAWVWYRWRDGRMERTEP
jgi:branched-chain amino acid transport system substrate-binding protein